MKEVIYGEEGENMRGNKKVISEETSLLSLVCFYI